MKKLIFVIFIFAFFVGLNSCNKGLNLPPQSQISSIEYWKSASDLKNYTVQFYASLPNFINAGGYVGPISGNYLGTIGYDGIMGADDQIYSAPISQLNGTITETISAKNGNSWDWTNIRALNIFFENYQNVKTPFSNIAQYVGEAHFFKAWFYFDKVKAFGDVPWYTNSLQMTDSALYRHRTPRTQVIDSCLMHLDSAIADLDYVNRVAGGNNVLSKEAALIFKSRVALFEGSWEKYHAGTPFGVVGANPAKYFQIAVDAVTDLMTPGKYAVGIYNTGHPENDYNTLFNSTNLSAVSEVVLWCKYDNTQGFAHNFQQFITSSTGNISITHQLVENYLSKTGLPYNYDDTAAIVKGTAYLTKIANDCDPRLSQTIWIPGQTMWNNSSGTVVFTKPFLDKTDASNNNTGYQLSKGSNPTDPTAGGALGFSTSCNTGAVVFRYAEALLNYAEAQAELGKAVDYSQSLGLLRTRAGMPAFTVQSDNQRNKYANFGYPLTDELYEIRRERSVELACEGFRYDDWRRWAAGALFSGQRPTGFPYLASEYASGLNVLTNASGFVDPFKNLLPSGYNFNTNRDYLINIPINEITLNPNLSQNPGW